MKKHKKNTLNKRPTNKSDVKNKAKSSINKNHLDIIKPLPQVNDFNQKKVSVTKPKKASNEMASKASRTLRNERSSKISKSLAGSVLATKKKQSVKI